MFDLHYDLLSICKLLKQKGKKELLKEYLLPFQMGKMKGVFANLYFMSEEEMRKTFSLSKEEIKPFSLFLETKEMLDQNLSTKIVYSMEGCDYIESEEELEHLYQSGLDSILLVWNHKNKYGSGALRKGGLTEEGKSFLRKAIDLSMGIDLSHMNKETFLDTIELIKEEQKKGKEVIVYASHSNSDTLWKNKRNLDDVCLKKLNEVGGMIGCVLYPPFVGSKKIEDYIKHLEYMISIFGYHKVMIASDNMEFLSLCGEEKESFYSYSSMVDELQKELEKKFSKEVVESLLFKNAEVLYNKIKKGRNKND